MKLKHLLAETSADELSAWVDEANDSFTIMTESNYADATLLRVTDHKLDFSRRSTSYYFTNSASTTKKWDCPASPNDWLIAARHDITVSFVGLELENFKNVPNVRKIVVSDNCIIRSFAGIEKLNKLESISMRRCKIDAGVLPLLKAPQLHTVYFTKAFGRDDNVNRKLEEIIEEFLQKDGHDMADVIERLHDEGLEEFAKL